MEPKTGHADNWVYCDWKHLLVVDCVNSSPALISRKFQGFGGIRGNSGNFRKTHGNSVEFSGVLYGT